MDQTKSGWQTSELWTHVALSIGIAILTALGDVSDSLPVWAKTALSLGGPLAIGWMQGQYSKGRSAVKVAAIQSDAEAVDVLRAPPPAAP